MILPPIVYEESSSSTVEIPKVYKLVDPTNGKVYGKVKLSPQGFLPWQKVFGIADIGPRLKAMSQSGKLRYNPVKMAIRLGEEPNAKSVVWMIGTDEDWDDDCCPKCGVPGVFIRTAFICPNCKDFLGGI